MWGWIQPTLPYDTVQYRRSVGTVGSRLQYYISHRSWVAQAMIRSNSRISSHVRWYLLGKSICTSTTATNHIIALQVFSNLLLSFLAGMIVSFVFPRLNVGTLSDQLRKESTVRAHALPSDTHEHELFSSYSSVEVQHQLAYYIRASPPGDRQELRWRPSKYTHETSPSFLSSILAIKCSRVSLCSKKTPMVSSSCILSRRYAIESGDRRTWQNIHISGMKVEFSGHLVVFW